MDPEHHQTKRDGGGGDETDLQTPPAPPRLCANNCGFFGKPATDNLCSKCYKQAYMLHLSNSSSGSSKQPTTAVAASTATVDDVLAASTTARQREQADGETSLPFSSSSSSSPAATTAPAKPNRCSSCRKKVGLMGFWCRCGGVFCPTHRYTDKHACAFDYKAEAKDAIARANPVLKPDKLDKI